MSKYNDYDFFSYQKKHVKDMDDMELDNFQLDVQMEKERLSEKYRQSPEFMKELMLQIAREERAKVESRESIANRERELGDTISLFGRDN